MNSNEEETIIDSSQLIPSYYGLLGIEIVEASDGKSLLRLPFKDDLSIPGGIMHGGAIASLADSAVAIALFTLIEPETGMATINLNVNYLAPVKSEITAEAEIIRKGSRTAVGDVEVKDKKGKLVAKASAAYAILK